MPKVIKANGELEDFSEKKLIYSVKEIKHDATLFLKNYGAEGIIKLNVVDPKEIFAEKNINFVQAEISVVDLKEKNIRTMGGEVLSYDYLVIALGSQTADFGIIGIAEYTYQFKSIDDAVAINAKIVKF